MCVYKYTSVLVMFMQTAQCPAQCSEALHTNHRAPLVNNIFFLLIVKVSTLSRSEPTWLADGTLPPECFLRVAATG